jgi:hypothetical protein
MLHPFGEKLLSHSEMRSNMAFPCCIGLITIATRTLPGGSLIARLANRG